MTDETAGLGPSPPEKGVGWYVYSVCPRGSEISVTGGIEDGGQPLFIPEGPIMAVTSPVSLAVFASEALRRNTEDPQWLAEKACRHEAVVEALMASGPVLPMRFGTVFRSLEAVHRMLREYMPRFQHALEFVRGKEEWGVKGVSDAGALRAAVLRGDPTLVALSSEASTKQPGEAFFLRRKMEEGASAKAQDREEWLARQAVETIQSAVVELAEHPPLLHETKRGERIVLNLACLVGREEVKAFLATVERWNRGHGKEGVRLLASGPWPPYHFVPRLDDER